jgi:aspartate/methionine/tyrosine aminotransferase
MANIEPFVPPPYPYERLDALKAVADALPGGVVDCSIGTPCDPVPEFVAQAAADAAQRSMGYPPSAGTAALHEAVAGWMHRRLGVEVSPAGIGACIGTKEMVVSLPQYLALRDPARDTVLYPAIAYPSYEMGATLARLRGVPVPLDAEWHLDLDAISAEDAARALVLWINEPGNPSSSPATNATSNSPRPGCRSCMPASTACSRCTAFRSGRTSRACGSASSRATPISCTT